MAVTVHHGDCRAVMAGLPEASIDACVTDPPYHLTSIVKRFGGANAAPAQHGTDGAYARASRGFMGKTWDGGGVAQDPATWAAVLRVLKPGAHLVVFSGTRTYHRMVCAIEDAGFEVRDQLAWVYASGFPKSHNVSKALDRAAGVERGSGGYVPNGRNGVWGRGMGGGVTTERAAPATDLARQWQGWGTALKPAWEPICLARRPLIGTVAANVAAHGTGAINVDECRVAYVDAADAEAQRRVVGFNKSYGNGEKGVALSGSADGSLHRRDRAEFDPSKGRWPANLIHDGSAEATGGMSEAARYFYSPKADATDRLGSKHPTVKPVDLMAWLCRLVTPPGGTVLDPFAGSGSTGMAAMREGFNAVLIEMEAESVADIRRRVAHVHGADIGLFSQPKGAATDGETSC